MFGKSFCYHKAVKKNHVNFNNLMILVGIVFVTIAWASHGKNNTSLDIIFAVLGGFFIGGALAKKKK
jgi:uncharacterized membrane protein